MSRWKVGHCGRKILKYEEPAIDMIRKLRGKDAYLMHCPQCGQQVSGEVRFCKGCGFALPAVRELLLTGGVPQTETDTKKSGVSPRRRGVRQGAIVLFIAICLLPLTAVLGDSWGELIPAMLCLAGLMRMLYAGIFQEGAPSKMRTLNYPPPNRLQVATPASTTALPPAQGVPVSDFQAPRGTNEMIEVPSVTDHTTELLNKSQ